MRPTMNKSPVVGSASRACPTPCPALVAEQNMHFRVRVCAKLANQSDSGTDTQRRHAVQAHVVQFALTHHKGTLREV